MLDFGRRYIKCKAHHDIYSLRSPISNVRIPRYQWLIRNFVKLSFVRLHGIEGGQSRGLALVIRECIAFCLFRLAVPRSRGRRCLRGHGSRVQRMTRLLSKAQAGVVSKSDLESLPDSITFADARTVATISTVSVSSRSTGPDIPSQDAIAVDVTSAALLPLV
jgi:hypothetical protein